MMSGSRFPCGFGFGFMVELMITGLGLCLDTAKFFLPLVVIFEGIYAQGSMPRFARIEAGFVSHS